MNSIRVEETDGVLRIVLNRPPLNILDLSTLARLREALEEAKMRETDLRLLVLAAEGDRAFSAGVEVADHTPEKADRMIAAFHDALRALMRLDVPTVGVARGRALGGGAELLLACDLVFCSEDAKIGFPEIRLGHFPPFAAAVLPQLVGEKKAFELVLGGEPLTAREAQELGLVNRVFPTAEFSAIIEMFLSGIAGLSGSSLKLAKRALRAGRGKNPEDALAAAEGLYLSELLATADAREGIAAFLEKRPPAWKHR
jgi:cyclohexa-1,5-dienecarbonyl-CoA hydratase